MVDDALWSLIEPLLPKRRPRNRRYAGRTPIPDRAGLTGILFVLRSGLPWNMLPRELGCGSGSTCWQRLVRWQRAGVWKRLHAVLLTELRRRGELDLARAASSGVEAVTLRPPFDGQQEVSDASPLEFLLIARRGQGRAHVPPERAADMSESTRSLALS